MARLAREPERAENQERWLITYADMITLLLVLFIVLYATSNADKAKFASLSVALQRAFNVDVLKGFDAFSKTQDAIGNESLVQTMKQDMELLRKQIDNLVRPGLAPGGVEMEANQEGILIRLSGNLLFDSGKATIKDEAVPVLASLASVLAGLPYPLRVEGHTDSIPIQTQVYPSNWELSTARATAVVRYLEDVRVSPLRMQAVGYGDTRPVNPNDKRDQRARNRRVDIQIIYPGAAYSLSNADLRLLQAPQGDEGH